MESLVTIAITGTECITNRQTDKQTFFFIYRDTVILLVSCIGAPVARGGLIFFGKKVDVDLFLDVKIVFGKFGCISSYGLQTHSEQTNKQTDILLYIYRLV